MGQSGDQLDKNKVILGLSGGVDSTAAALLLQEQGYQVLGLYFDVLENNPQGRLDAEKTADQLGIPFIYRNVHQLFQSTVVENFCQEYLTGRTPNPCVFCNPVIKFRVLIEEANRRGAWHIATGHYADTGFNPELGWAIKKAGSQKDQSYMLYRLSSSVIERLLLPLAQFQNKEETRRIARKSRMYNAEKKDSQEICFLSENESYAEYIRKKGYTIKEGNFINRKGEILGRHRGLVHYTVGQRKGLGITFGKPVFVTGMDSATCTVTLGEHEDLFSREVICSGSFFPATESRRLPQNMEGRSVEAKVRYAAKPVSATVTTMPDGRIRAFFRDRQRAVTPGQSIVFYLDDFVIGGGFIDSADD